MYDNLDMIKRLLDWLIILLPFALPLYVVRFNVGLLPTTILEVYVLVLIATWLLSRVNSGQGSVTDNSSSPSFRMRNTIFEVRSSIGLWFWPIVTWLAVTLVAVFVATDSWGAFGHWRAFMLEPILVFIILIDVLHRSSQSSHVDDRIVDKPHHDKGEVWRRLFLSIATVTILLGVYAIFQFVTGLGIPSPWDAEVGRRATGTFGYPNGLSLFIVPFGITSFIKLVQIKNYELRIKNFGWDSIIFFLATISAGFGAVLAKSMGGILAFGIGIVLTLVLFKKTRIVGLALSAIGILGAGLFAWQIYGTEMHPQTVEDTLAASKKWSSSVRVIIWQESFEIIKDHPILGTGLRSFKTAILPYHEATWMETFPHPHNIFMMLWIETGIAGLLAFIWLIGTWANTVLRPASQLSHVNGANDEGRVTGDVRRYIWLIPLVVIMAHGMVDMPYFKNDLAVQFFLLAAIATRNSKLKIKN